MHKKGLHIAGKSDKNGHFDPGERGGIKEKGNELVINIKTNNEVISNNADKVNGNVYTWIINKDNKDKVDIQIRISKHTIYLKTIIYSIIGILFIVLLFVGYIFYNKFKNRDSVNDI